MIDDVDEGNNCNYMYHDASHLHDPKQLESTVAANDPPERQRE